MLSPWEFHAHPGSSEPGGKPSIVNPTDAVTKDNAVPFFAQTLVNKTDSSDVSRGLVWDQLRREACLGMSCLLPCLFVVIS